MDINISATLTAAMPTTLDECKKDGWKNWLVFKTQGDCVSFVDSGGANAPANS